MTDVQVHVSNGGRDLFAGTLYNQRRRGSEASTFTYNSDFLIDEAGYALDPELPLTSGALHTGTSRAIFGAFTDCAPDRWGRTLLNRQEAALAAQQGRAVRSLGEFDYLLGVRDDLRQGALPFRAAAGPFIADDETGVPALTDLPALMNLADRAESGATGLPDLQRLVRVGGSLGGARPKAHVRDLDGRIAIAKFPSADHDTWNVMAWEKVALDLASAARITVPKSRLLRLAGRSVLVIDRFDRTEKGDRVGYVSAMTMLEAADGEQRSYLEIAEVVEQQGADSTSDLHQLWRRIVFSILISNTDDHLRNHGFLHVAGAVWRLAPAFDLNPDPTPGPKYLSTAIDEADGSASLALALAVAEFFRLDQAEARVILAEVAGAVADWPRTAQRHGLTGSELTRMEPAFAALAQVETG